MNFSEKVLKDPAGTDFNISEWIPDSPAVGLVFLVHGLADHAGRFHHVAEAFNRQGWVFFAPDLRGNGKSGGKRGHFDSHDQMVGDLDFLLNYARERHPDLPVLMYGQSMGGNLVLYYCMKRNPEITAAVASSPWLRLAKPPSAPVKALGSLITGILPKLAVPNGVKARDLSHDYIIQDEYLNDPLVHGKVTLKTYRLITDAGEWMLRNASSWKLPLMLLHGKADKITSFEASRLFGETIGHSCKFVAWDCLFHELHNEPEKDKVLTEIIDWVNNIRNN